MPAVFEYVHISGRRRLLEQGDSPGFVERHLVLEVFWVVFAVVLEKSSIVRLIAVIFELKFVPDGAVLGEASLERGDCLAGIQSAALVAADCVDAIVVTGQVLAQSYCCTILGCDRSRLEESRLVKMGLSTTST